MTERNAFTLPGIAVLILHLALLGAAVTLLFVAQESAIAVVVVLFFISAVVGSGYVINPPNQSKVVTFFGRYLGTVRRNGFSWTWPLTLRQKVSLRIRNFDSDTLKVNDANGNPVEVAAVIVWRVVDTAKAMFEVDDYQQFVHIQTETAVRHMAAEYPYDAYDEEQHSLRANADEVTASLHTELQEHLTPAGVEVLRTQLRRLAYAPEIAADMLRRQ